MLRGIKAVIRLGKRKLRTLKSEEQEKNNNRHLDHGKIRNIHPLQRAPDGSERNTLARLPRHKTDNVDRSNEETPTNNVDPRVGLQLGLHISRESPHVIGNGAARIVWHARHQIQHESSQLGPASLVTCQDDAVP